MVIVYYLTLNLDTFLFTSSSIYNMYLVCTVSLTFLRMVFVNKYYECLLVPKYEVVWTFKEVVLFILILSQIEQNFHSHLTDLKETYCGILFMSI